MLADQPTVPSRDTNRLESNMSKGNKHGDTRNGRTMRKVNGQLMPERDLETGSRAERAMKRARHEALTQSRAQAKQSLRSGEWS